MNDCHVHSNFSFDSDVPIKSYVESAIQYEYDAIFFTEHCEFIENNKFFENYIKEIEQLKYSHTLFIGAALEVDLPYIERIDKSILKKLDFSLGSFHQLAQSPLEYYINLLDKLSDKDILSSIDALAHIDFPLRNDDIARTFMKLYNSDFEIILYRILKKLVDSNKVLEINISNLEGNETRASMIFYCNIIQKYREIGGKYFCYGSDSHSLADFRLSYINRKKYLDSLKLNESDFVIFKKHKIVKN